MTAVTEFSYDSASPESAWTGTVRSLYRYRGLIRLIVVRDLTVRYKRSLLGVSWTVLNPLLTTLVMWVVFNKVFRFQIPGNIPFIVYLLSGVLLVTYFQQGVSMTSASMTTSAGVLTKVYVPPEVFAVAAAVAGAVNLVLGAIPLLVIQVAVGVGLPWTVVLTPVPVLFLLGLISGVGLLVAVLAIQYNDVLDLVQVLLVLVGYLTPTFYPITIIPAGYRHLFLLNPLFSFVDVFRNLVYGGTFGPWSSWLIVVVTGTTALLLGLTVFARRWPTLAALL